MTGGGLRGAVEHDEPSWCPRPTLACAVAAAQVQVDRAAERAELAERVRTAEREVAHLHRALASNRRIGIAIGLLVVRYGLSPDQGIEFLRRVSQEQNVAVRDLAETIIGSGAPPSESVRTAPCGDS